MGKWKRMLTALALSLSMLTMACGGSAAGLGPGGPGPMSMTPEEALAAAEQAVETGNGFTLFDIGQMYEQGKMSQDGQPDYENAMKYYTLAAEAANANCKGVRNIGQWYEKGNAYVEQDYQEAARYYIWAIEIDDASSCAYLGNLYEQGYLSDDGTPDYENAVKYYQMGYDKNNPGATGLANAIYRLGYFYENGICVEADEELMRTYYGVAAANGSEEAAEACKRLGIEIPAPQNQQRGGFDAGFVPGALPPGGGIGMGPQGGVSGNAGGMMPDKSTDETLQRMVTELTDKFTSAEYTDEVTGLTVPYSIYLPDDYDENASYPMVVFIADSSVTGTNLTAPITQGYGAYVWMTPEAQAEIPCIVMVPCYPTTILDDHGAYTKTDYVDLTPRMIRAVASAYAVDTNRIYGTGQSMGCMTLMINAANQPDLFAACMFVDGQWDVNELKGLASQAFCFFAAEGDDRAYSGMQELIPMLEENGAKVVTAQWNAKWSEDEMAAAVQALTAQENPIYCITWELGSVLPEGVAVGTMEHMHSFDYAYRCAGMREWLLSQSK